MIITKSKDICSKRNLYCECEQCQEAWQEAYGELDKELGMSSGDYDYEAQKELDKIYEKDGW